MSRFPAVCLIAVFLFAFSTLAADFDGDSRDDPAIFRPSSGLWSVKDLTRVYYGQSTDEPRPGDFTGDGIADIAIFRAATGLWAVKDITRVYYGASSDIPLQGGGGQRLYDYVVKPGDAADLVAALESDTLNSVFIPAGTYNVSEVIEVDNVRHIIGESNTANIVFGGDGQYLSVTRDNCHLQGFRVTGGGDTSFWRGNIYLYADYVTVENCRSIDSLAHGFYYGKADGQVSFINCIARNSTDNGFYVHPLCPDSRLVNCTASGFGPSTSGFRYCKNLSGCVADGGDAAETQGFFECSQLVACRAQDVTWNGYADCLRLSACTADGSNMNVGFHTCYNLSGCHVGNLDPGGTAYYNCSEEDTDSCD